MDCSTAAATKDSQTYRTVFGHVEDVGREMSEGALKAGSCRRNTIVIEEAAREGIASGRWQVAREVVEA